MLGARGFLVIQPRVKAHFDFAQNVSHFLRLTELPRWLTENGMRARAFVGTRMRMRTQSTLSFSPPPPSMPTNICHTQTHWYVNIDEFSFLAAMYAHVNRYAQFFPCRQKCTSKAAILFPSQCVRSSSQSVLLFSLPFIRFMFICLLYVISVCFIFLFLYCIVFD